MLRACAAFAANEALGIWGTATAASLVFVCLLYGDIWLSGLFGGWVLCRLWTLLAELLRISESGRPEEDIGAAKSEPIYAADIRVSRCAHGYDHAHVVMIDDAGAPVAVAEMTRQRLPAFLTELRAALGGRITMGGMGEEPADEPFDGMRRFH